MTYTCPHGISPVLWKLKVIRLTDEFGLSADEARHVIDELAKIAKDRWELLAMINEYRSTLYDIRHNRVLKEL